MTTLEALAQIPPTWHYPATFCVFATAATYVFSLITRNVSQVDRIWTFLPNIYIAYFALLPLWPIDSPRLYGIPLMPYTPKEVDVALRGDYHPRALVMLVLVTLWMFRLSYNTWRRGLFNLRDEDYRWAVLRARVSPLIFQVLNLVFIAITQNLLLLALSVPASLALSTPRALTSTDYILASLALGVLFTEFTADNQQYSFQSYKHALIARSHVTSAYSSGSNGKTDESKNLDITSINHRTNWPFARIRWTPADARRGFVTRGLWAWTRHPNFLCEQTFWVIITAFPVIAPLSPYQLTFSSLKSAPLQSIAPILPALSLIALFISSTIFTESISISKYPAGYAAYQRRVGMFLPIPWGWIVGRDMDGMLWGKTKGE